MKTLLTITLGFITIASSAQDIIKLRSGTFIEVKVSEIEQDKVRYKKTNNINGPSYSNLKSEIEYIKFENGQKEIFPQNTQRGDYTKVPNQDASSRTQNSSYENQRVVQPPVNDGIGIAEVNKINGIDVYCMNAPLIPYTNAFSGGSLESDIDLKSIVWGGLAREDVAGKMNKIVNVTLKKADKEGVRVDAIIYSGGRRAIAIKYVGSNIPGISLAKVQRINNVELYAMSEPANKKYTILNEGKAKSGGFTSMASYGLLNSTIDQDLKKMVERLDGNKKKKIDAVIYSTGKKGVGIKFN